MDMRRILQNIFFLPWRLKQLFPSSALRAISTAVAQSEKLHSAQIRVALEGNIDLPDLLRGLDVRARARQVFSELGVWDTAANNGVLIYLLLAERRVEIIADRGADAVIPKVRWEAICAAMQAHFSNGEFETGVLLGIQQIGAELALYFPPGAANNELPDSPALL